MIKINSILRFIKKWAIHMGIITTTIYISICSYNMFVNYENYQYTHELTNYLIHKTTDELPVAKSDDHKFVNSILSSSNSREATDNYPDSGPAD